MCPACVATAALVIAGVTSAGGLTALVVKKFRKKSTKEAETLACSRGGVAFSGHHAASQRDT